MFLSALKDFRSVGYADFCSNCSSRCISVLCLQVEPEERRKFIGLNIFMMPWNTNVSSVVHRLFLIPAAIFIIVINTEACRLKDYKGTFEFMFT